MSAAAPPSPTPSSPLGEILRQPVVGLLLAVGYVVIVAIVLLSLDRADTYFPLMSMIAFPALILSPVIVLRTTLPRVVKAILVGVILLLVLPIVGISDSSYLELAIQISIFAALAIGLNIVVGFAGLLDLGFIAFFAVGAYLWAMFTSTSPTIFLENGWTIPPQVVGLGFIIFIFLGMLAAAGAGVLLGLPVLRLRGDYLAIVTLGFGELIRILARNADSPINFTNGSQGLLNVGRPEISQVPGAVDFITNIITTFNFSVAGNIAPLTQQILFYFIAILMLGLAIVVASRLHDSVIGRAWNAIREDEVAAIAMGVPLVRMKLLAFASGAAFAGAIGVLYGAKQTFVSPDSFSLLNSISILAMVIVGGLGSVRGVLLGAVIVVLLQLQVLKNLSLQLNALRNIDAEILGFAVRDWPTQLEPAKYERLVFGLLLILMMLFRPKGLLPENRRRLAEEHQDDSIPPRPGAAVRLPASSGD